MGYVRTPYSISMARSPIVIIVNESFPEENNYPYVLYVRVWRGDLGTPIGDEYQLKRFPDENGNGVFDVAPIIRGYFDDIPYALPNETTGDLAVNFQVRYGWIEPTGPSPTFTSSVFQAQIGFNRFTDDINHRIDNYQDGWLTDMPDDIYLPSDMPMSLFVRNVTGSTWAGYRLESDVGVSSTNFRTTPNPPTTSEETVLNFHVGPGDNTAWIAANVANWYDVQLIDGSSQKVGRPIRIHLTDTCKYPVHKVDFINKYGVWDRFVFYGSSKYTTTTTNLDAMRHIQIPESGEDWRTSQGQFIKFNKQGKEKVMVNTNWVEESYNNFFEQMLLSERVVFDSNAAIVVDSSKQWKTDVVDKLINYEFTFESAFTAINSIF